MSRPWVRPAAIAVGAVLYVLLMAWLMLHGHIDVAVGLLVIGVLALLGLAVWQWRRGHRGWSAGLVAGAVVVVAATGGYKQVHLEEPTRGPAPVRPGASYEAWGR